MVLHDLQISLIEIPQLPYASCISILLWGCELEGSGDLLKDVQLRCSRVVIQINILDPSQAFFTFQPASPIFMSPTWGNLVSSMGHLSKLTGGAFQTGLPFVGKELPRNMSVLSLCGLCLTACLTPISSPFSPTGPLTSHRAIVFKPSTLPLCLFLLNQFSHWCVLIFLRLQHHYWFKNIPWLLFSGSSTNSLAWHSRPSQFGPKLFCNLMSHYATLVTLEPLWPMFTLQVVPSALGW